MPTQDQLLLLIQQRASHLKTLKNYSKAIDSRQKALSSQAQVKSGPGLSDMLAQFIRPELMPTNVGHMNSIAWPFWYQVAFDLGTDPTLTINTRQTQFFQVTQEAGFIFNKVYRHADAYSGAGDLGPLAVEFRDKQSSRFFQSTPTPIQMFGDKSLPAYLPTPMLLMPNAILEVTMSTLLDDGVSQDTEGSGHHVFTFEGYRIRIEDAGKVLSSIYR